MELVPYSEEHRALTAALETDPVAMRELGGAVDPSEIDTIHRRRLDAMAAEPWWFAIAPEPGGRAVGCIGIWAAEHFGEPMHETGWMVLPAVHGQGIATTALDLLLTRAREARAFERIHAFPAVTNTASNALCRRAGFERLEDVALPYRAGVLACAHWALALYGLDAG